MRVAYFTPLNPLKSGISDWAEELLPELKRFFEIELFVGVNPGKISNNAIKTQFKVHPLSDYDDENVRASFDVALFQAGNNGEIHEPLMKVFMKYGGILELHDVAMHHYLYNRTVGCNNVDLYFKILDYCHGKYAIDEAKREFEGKRKRLYNEPLKYCGTKHFIDRSDAVIVHSDFARQMVKGIAPDKKVIVIPLHCAEIVDDAHGRKLEARKALGIPEARIVIASFGFVNYEKRILQVIEQIKNISRLTRQDFRYYIVGQNIIPELESVIKGLDIADRVVCTGSVSLELFKTYMVASDLCFNLRFPTQGESSASLMRLLGYGKQVVVTDIGSFHDFPDEYVYKVRYGIYEGADILRCLIKFFKNHKNDRSEEILSYTKENFSLSKTAERYKSALCEGNDFSTYEDMLADRIMEYYPYHQSILRKIMG